MTRSRALTPLYLLGLLIVPACNDDGSNTDEVGEVDADSSTSAGDTSEATSAAESSTTTTGTSSTTTDTTSTTDSTDTTDTTSTTESTTESTTGDPDNSTYSAVAFPGGLDRVIITRMNPDEPSCSEMVLVKPGFDVTIPLTLPATWAVEQVRSWDQLDCDSMVTPDSLGKNGNGTVEFLGTDAFGLYPCAVSFDAEINMDTDPPSKMNWFSDFVLVEGVNCG